MTAADANGTLLALAAERLLLPGERVYDHRELAERTGTSPEDLGRLWLALGFAGMTTDEKRFTDTDVKVIRTLVADGTQLSSEYTLHEARIISSSLARIAEVFIDEQWDQHRAAGQSDREALGEMEGIDLGRIEGLLLSLLRMHLVAAVYRRSALHDEMQQFGQPSFAIGFADLTGFTELSQRFTAEELTRAIVRFEQQAFDLIAEHGGRVIKTIGDEVMFTVDTADRAVELALRLSAAAGHDVAPLRIGLAFGPVLIRQGDCFGPTVNLASRIAGIARSGEVVIDDATARAVADDPRFALVPIGSTALKGIGDVQLTLVHEAR